MATEKNTPTTVQTSPPSEVAQLRQEVAQLRAELAEARRNPGADPQPVKWERPSFGLSEGERADLEQYGTTRSAFTGEELTASAEGVTPANPEAEARDKAVKKARG